MSVFLQLAFSFQYFFFPRCSIIILWIISFFSCSILRWFCRAQSWRRIDVKFLNLKFQLTVIFDSPRLFQQLQALFTIWTFTVWFLLAINKKETKEKKILFIHSVFHFKLNYYYSDFQITKHNTPNSVRPNHLWKKWFVNLNFEQKIPKLGKQFNSKFSFFLLPY